jgi:hypothetical protein
MERKYMANKYFYTPMYVAGDLPLIGADALGTVGAEAVVWAPLVVPAALAYGGAKLVAKRKKERAKQGKGFFADKKKFAVDHYAGSSWNQEDGYQPEFETTETDSFEEAKRLAMKDDPSAGLDSDWRKRIRRIG